MTGQRVNNEYLRSILFGVEDSLVSTTGLIAGLSVGSDSKNIVILGALVAIAIEAVSMGAGEYLSDEAVQELDNRQRHADNPLTSGLLMLTSYFLAGFVPLLPVLLLPFPVSVVGSIVFAFTGLFLLGYVKGKVVQISPLKSALKILVVGGIATALGTVVGLAFQV